MMQVTVVDHPLIKQKITKMRAEHTSSRDFRECLDEIAMLMTMKWLGICRCRKLKLPLR